MMKELHIRTQRRAQLLDITSQVAEVVRESAIEQGWATVFVPHTTAGITINENADPAVATDMLAALERIVPQQANYRHTEGNSDAHVKASLMGFSVMTPIEGGRLKLGTWQAIYFCEFDGPRARRVLVSVMGDKAAG